MNKKTTVVFCLMLALLIGESTASFATTFEFETATDGTSIVTETIDGITVSITANGGSSDNMQIINGGGYAGSSGNVVLTDGSSNTSMTFSFDTTVDISSIYAMEAGNTYASTFTYIPTGGSNSQVIDPISAGTGHTVTLGWTGITSFTVTKPDDGASFAFDDLVLQPGASSPPTTQAHDVSFSSTTSSETTVNWARGDGENCIVFMAQASSGTANPIDNNSYTANTVFGSGSQLGTSGWYCIYKGSANNVSVVGLTESTPYRVQVFEYNGGAGSQSYLTDAATANPNNFTTSMISEGAGQITGITIPSTANGEYSKDILVNGKQSWKSSNGYYVYWVNYNSTDYWLIDDDTSPSNDADFNIESSANTPPTTGYTGPPARSTGNPLLSGFTLNVTPAISIDSTSLTYTENAGATQIDNTATVNDSDGDSDWNGGTLAIQITTNAESSDEISIPDNVVGTINTSGISIRNSTTVIGTLSASEGTVTNDTTLTITFNSNATNALVQQVLQALHYRNTSDDPGTSDRTITATATDKNGADASDTRIVALTAVNDEPTLTATGTNPTFIEDGSAAIVYTSASASTIESTQSITGCIVTVSNVNDDASEILNADGTAIVLTHGTGGSTATNAMSYNVSVTATTATVTFSGGAVSTANFQTLINGITYQNNSNTPNITSNRVVTLISITDSGSNTGSNDNVAALAIASTVTVVANNDAPTLTTFAGAIESTNQNTEVEITLAELSALGNENDVDGTVDAFLVQAVSSGTLNIGTASGTASPFNAATNNTIDGANNGYWTPAANVYGVQNAFTTTVRDNGGAESSGAVQATIQVNDVTTPEVSNIALSGTPSAADASITFVVTFSEQVNNISTDDFTLTKTDSADGTVASVSASTGTSINVTVNSISGTGTLRLDLNASSNIADGTGNTPPPAYTSGSVHTVDRDTPTLSTTIPADNAAEVAPSSTLTLTFNEDIAFGTGNVQIIDIDDGSGTITIDAASPGSQASIANNVLTLTPTSDFEDGTNYAVQIAATAIDDSYGNSFAGIADNTTFNFITSTPPTIAFNTVSSNGDESANSTNLQVNLSASSLSTISVNYSVTGTATGGGTDYTLANGTLTIPAGAVSRNITITGIVDDSLDEDNETVIVTLSSPSNATLGTNTVHTYTINDNDDAPTVAFTAASQTSSDESGTITVTAQLSAVSGKVITVPFTVDGSSTATGSGTDYTISTSPLTIAAGSNSADVTITLTDDALVEDDESVIINMETPTNAALGTVITHSATITDDDASPRISQIVRYIPLAATTSADSVTFQITFSKDMQNVDTADFSLGGTAAGDGTIFAVNSTSSSIYTVNITGLADSDGTVNLDIAAGHNLQDSNTNSLINTTPTGEDQAYTLDNHTAPVISGMPGDITTKPDPGQETAVVNWTEPTAYDAVDGAVVPIQTEGFANGSAFPLGTTTVTYTATDSQGNESTDSFSITVNKERFPWLILMPALVLPNGGLNSE